MVPTATPTVLFDSYISDLHQQQQFTNDTKALQSSFWIVKQSFNLVKSKLWTWAEWTNWLLQCPNILARKRASKSPSWWPVQGCGYELLSFTVCILSFISCVCSNLFIIPFQWSQVFSCLWEFTFFHALTHIPVDKCPLAVHQVKFVIDTRENLGYSCGVTDHAYSPAHLCKITARHYCWWLMIDSTLESSWTPAISQDN